ncbi:pleckstrin homology domain-containing family O member 1-A [Megalops cyprinoides]|uniref:pleckstrin homology domain-containing family O member 1-A n=1 Tax=Megalops cyprinoides TaxID=118141 RepID=UPI001864EAF7|nr:pleckstrin homology domain-containing family O member 1-A [Megalops cyprinoides]
MKKSNSKRGPHDTNQQLSQPDKTGWIRKFCGKGIFREIWKNRFVVLKGDHLYISEKEVKDEKRVQEVINLTDYERSEELRKSKSRSKKNHSKFTLLRSRQPGNMVPNLVFLAVSPEEKEAWINVLNAAITRAKNSILDEVTVEEHSPLAHLTRDRAKIPHARRLPTRGHLMAVASTSTSDGMLTLDLIQEEDGSAPDGRNPCEISIRVDLDDSAPRLAPGRQRCNTDITGPARLSAEIRTKSGSLPRRCEPSQDWRHLEGQSRTPQPGKRLTPSEKSRCVSMEEILSRSDAFAARRCSPAPSPAPATPPLQELISRKLERTQELLGVVRSPERGGGNSPSSGKGSDSQGSRAEAEQLLQEAVSAWDEAREVLEEVKELQVLFQQLDLAPTAPLTPSREGTPSNPQQTP